MAAVADFILTEGLSGRVGSDLAARRGQRWSHCSSPSEGDALEEAG